MSAQLRPRELTDAQLHEIDVIASENIDCDFYTQMFVTLADASECGLIQRLAEGDAVGFTNYRQQDTFARLAKLADQMKAERLAAVERAS